MSRLVEQAEGLVVQHWPQIETVAQALLTTETLEGDEVERLILRRGRGWCARA
jgi:ATP-dependent Zn protease